MNAPSDITESKSKKGSKKKKKKGVYAQMTSSKNEWDILNEAEAQALLELPTAFVNPEKESRRVKYMVDKLYCLNEDGKLKPDNKRLDEAISAQSVQALFLKAEALAKDDDLKAAYNCAIECKRKAVKIDRKKNAKKK